MRDYITRVKKRLEREGIPCEDVIRILEQEIRPSTPSGIAEEIEIVNNKELGRF